MHNDAHPDWNAIRPCDAHVHVYARRSFGWNLQFARGYREWFGLDRLALLALPESSHYRGRDDAANLRCLGVKAALNAEDPSRPVYSLAGLLHRDPDAPGTAADYAAQARRALATGHDGFKSLLGKPTLRRRAGFGPDHPVFDPFYDVLEETGKPFVLHSGDPATFWDPEKCPPGCREQGWFYGDPSFLPLAEIRREAENVLRKHPALHATFAHVFFLGEEPDEAERLLSTYPNLGLDLAPGWEMHVGFTKFRDRWHDLFERFRDRFYFATDSANWHASEDLSTYDYNFRWMVDLVRNAVEGDEPFECECDERVYRFAGLGLSPEAREAVQRGNFLRRFGETPAPVDRAAALEDARRLLAVYEQGCPEPTMPDAREASLPILRRWAASDETLFAPEPISD